MRFFICFVLLFVFPVISHAEFIISTAILEFTHDGPKQQDIELISRSLGSDYIEAEINEVLNPGSLNESRVLIENPAESGILVTPDKTILNGRGRKTLRFVVMKDLDDREHIYRVAVKPVIKGVESNETVGLKVLIGYEVLVIIRPSQINPSYQAKRVGSKMMIKNDGNTNILFQNGQQCSPEEKCKMPPVIRVYAGETIEADLPIDKPVSYSIWDGKKTIEKKFD